MWDNGIPDNPGTPINEHQILIAFGDTFGGRQRGRHMAAQHHLPQLRYQPRQRHGDPRRPMVQRQHFRRSPWAPNLDSTARQIIFPEGLPAGMTLIPTAGSPCPPAGTAFGATQYVSFMSVTQWGAPGHGRRTTPRSRTPTTTARPGTSLRRPSATTSHGLVTRTSSSRPSCGRATATSIPTARRTAGRAPHTCRALPRRTSWT